MAGRMEDKKIPRCSFCNKTQDQVRKLIAGPNAFICDECIGICSEIITEEFEEEEFTEEGYDEEAYGEEDIIENYEEPSDLPLPGEEE